MLTCKEINDACYKNSPQYIKMLKNELANNKPPLISDMLGITRKGDGVIRLTIKE